MRRFPGSGDTAADTERTPALSTKAVAPEASTPKRQVVLRHPANDRGRNRAERRGGAPFRNGECAILEGIRLCRHRAAFSASPRLRVNKKCENRPCTPLR